ncbi:MAG: hypothetical protein H0X69_07820 [Gemmatimonadales bacterium]|nr:hypothetical protein [Gemmatimonadales bacterium]
MALRALAVWFGILMLAVLNGGVRDTWLSPRLGDTVGRAISTLLLCGLIVLATWLTIALVVALFAPWWTARRRGLLGSGRFPAHGR